MHILVVNDDGPPSNQSSPYVHSLITSLQSAGHIVSVCLPHTQRSWIGKAHIIGQTVKPTYYRPAKPSTTDLAYNDEGTTHSRPLPAGHKDTEEWVLVDGTPASCVQIGLYHFFKDKGPIDLVVSGPNYGRNSTAVFSLSSGTLGGALEAAVCRRKSIALSYAFFNRNHDPEIIRGASALSVKLIEYLYANWGKGAEGGVDVYSVNVPLVDGVEEKKIFWTKMLQNYWGEGSCFQEVEDESVDPKVEEERIREAEESKDGGSEKVKDGLAKGVAALDLGKKEEGVTRHTHKHFKWAPRFTDVYKSVEEAGPGNDGWVVKEGLTSVTPLKANFMHAGPIPEGAQELKLPSISSTLHRSSTFGTLSSIPARSIAEEKLEPHFYAIIDYEDDYVQPLLLSALSSLFPSTSFTLLPSLSTLPTPSSPLLCIKQYESIPFDHFMTQPETSLMNSYIIRKALIRKHFLSTTCYNWSTKHPDSILATNVKPSCEFELDYAEFLDDALVEAWELQESWTKGQNKVAEEREWWILKPGMSDRGQGIRLFSSEDELREIFEKWEEEYPDSESEEEDDDDGRTGVITEEQRSSPSTYTTPSTSTIEQEEGTGIVTSHLRHFIAQPYIHPPLLLPGTGNRKFHLRTYVLSLGALKVFVYREMLALFASTPYSPPWESSPDLSGHLTNTCLQNPSSPTSALVCSFSHLSEEQMSKAMKTAIFNQICAITGEVFEAAAKGMMVHFQTLSNAFEVFGVDFLVDATGKVWLLEVNAFPDFRQSGGAVGGGRGEQVEEGGDCRWVVEGFWKAVVGEVVRGFFGVEAEKEEGLVLVREVDLGRR